MSTVNIVPAMLGTVMEEWVADEFREGFGPVLGQAAGAVSWPYAGYLNWVNGTRAAGPANTSYYNQNGTLNYDYTPSGLAINASGSFVNTSGGVPTTLGVFDQVNLTAGVVSAYNAPYHANLSLTGLTDANAATSLANAFAATQTFQAITLGNEAYGNWESSLANLVANPTVAPTLVASGTGSSLAAGNYLVAYTYTNNQTVGTSNGNVLAETMSSPVASLTVASGQYVVVDSLLPLPSGNVSPWLGAQAVRYYLAPSGTAPAFQVQGNGGTLALGSYVPGNPAPTFNSCFNPDYTGVTYARVAVPYLQAARAANPDVLLGVDFQLPSDTTDTNLAWTYPVFQAVAPYVDYVAPHVYYMGSSGVPASTIFTYLKQVAAWAGDLRTYLDTWVPNNNVEIWLTEFNVVDGNSAMTTLVTYAAVFVESTLLLWWYGVNRVFWWQACGTVTSAGLMGIVQYHGNATSALLTITQEPVHGLATTLTITLTGQTDGSQDVTVDLANSASYPTFNAVASYLNGLQGYSCSTWGSSGDSPSYCQPMFAQSCSGNGAEVCSILEGAGVGTYSLMGYSGAVNNVGVAPNTFFPGTLGLVALKQAMGTGAALWVNEPLLYASDVFMASVASASGTTWFMVNNNPHPVALGSYQLPSYTLVSGTVAPPLTTLSVNPPRR